MTSSTLGTLRFTSCMFTLVLLSGCKFTVSSDLYVADLFSDQNIEFPAQMRIEVPSCTSSRLSEIEQQVLSLFSQVSQAKISGCTDEGFDSYLNVAFSGEFANETSTYDLFFFRHISPNGYYHVKPVLNPTFLERARTFASSNYQSIDYDDLIMKITVHNDHRDTVEVNFDAGWIDDRPQQWSSNEIGRRQQLEYTAPNVYSAMILQGDAPHMLFIKPTDQSP